MFKRLKRLKWHYGGTYAWELEDGTEWETQETWPVLAFWMCGAVEIEV